MGTSIVFGSLKGGAGKTSTAANVATALAQRGHNVLAVDADPQGHLTESFSVERTSGLSLAELLHTPAPHTPPNLSDVIYPTDLETLFVIPAVYSSLEPIERQLDPVKGSGALRRCLEPVENVFDYIVFDTPPRLSMLTTNAVVAADLAIPVLEPQVYSLTSATAFATAVDEAREYLAARAKVLGWIGNKWQREAAETRTVEEAMRARGLQLLEPQLPISRWVSRATTESGIPAVAANPSSPYAQSVRALADQVIAASGVAVA